MNWKLHLCYATVIAMMGLVVAGCGGDESGAPGDGGASARSPERGTDLGAGGSTSVGAQTAGAADGSRFDPNDIDNALAWWIARIRELGEAERSGNQTRIGAARQELDGHLASLHGQRIRYTFRVRTPSVGGAFAIGDAISADGVYIAVDHETDHGAIRVGGQRDAQGRPHTESTPILVRPGEGIDQQMLAQLSTSSTFVASARIVDTTWLGSTFLRPPTLILFVDQVQVEQVNP